jgi:uncharacterized membrane protein YgcG
MRITLLLTFTLVGGAAWAQDTAPKPAAAAPTWQVDARWGSWVGCWRAEDDYDSSGVRLCIVPEGVPGVKMLTIVGTEARSTEIVIPDKVTRPISDADCRGTSRSEWSSNGRRLFRYTDVTCGTAPAQKLSGLTFLTEGPVLVDVQYADVPDNKSVRVRRYRRAANHTLPGGGIAPRSVDSSGSAIGEPWTVADVIEASGKVPGDAVQAALTQVGEGFRLNKANLLAMDAAGVADNVIDLMVALSYPKRFVVQPREPGFGGGGYGDGFMGPDLGWWDPFFAPLMSYSLMNYPCTPYSFGAFGCGPYYSAYRYGLYGYNYYYPYSPYYSGWVVVDSGSVSSVSNPSSNQVSPGEGRVVNGRGYTQIREREPVPVPGAGSSGYSGGGNTSSGTSSTGSSGVSTGGYSGGGSSGGDSGRTAVPRPPGGL